MTSVVLRAACDRETGTGHLRRCFTLARTLKSRGVQVLLVTDDDPVARQLTEPATDIPHRLVPRSAPLGSHVAGADTLVIDLPAAPRDSDVDRVLRRDIVGLDRAGTAVVSLGHCTTDTGHLRALIDLYPAQQLAAVNYVEGPDYLILRRHFSEGRAKRPESASAVFVAMGGTDPFDLTGTALEALGQAGHRGRVHVVLGAGHGTPTSGVEALAREQGLDARVHRELDTPDLVEVMSSCRAAIVAFGTTAYELMALGVPVFAFSHYRWQRESAESFAELQALEHLGCAEDGVDTASVGAEVREALNDTARLAQLGTQGARVVDGRGATRVADRVEGFAAESANRNLDHLYVLAHPGDEVFGCGGTILRQVKSGSRVGIIILGEGTASRQEGTEDPGILRNRRTGLTSALQHVTDGLGVGTLYYYRYSDNRFDDHGLLDLVKTVEILIERHRPTSVATHHPGDLNIDHRLTFEAVATATRPTTEMPVRQLLSVEVPSSSDWGATLAGPAFHPNMFVDVSEELDQKIELAAAYDSEVRPAPHPRSLEGIRTRANHWGHMAGTSAAEAFVIHRSLEDNP